LSLPDYFLSLRFEVADQSDKGSQNWCTSHLDHHYLSHQPQKEQLQFEKKNKNKNNNNNSMILQYLICFYFVFLSNFPAWVSLSPRWPPSRGLRSLGVVQPMSLMYIFMSVLISSAPDVFGFQRLPQNASHGNGGHLGSKNIQRM
jgi:hypothetical protein